MVISGFTFAGVIMALLYMVDGKIKTPRLTEGCQTGRGWLIQDRRSDDDQGENITPVWQNFKI